MDNQYNQKKFKYANLINQNLEAYVNFIFNEKF